jgi:hypothetical protein
MQRKLLADLDTIVLKRLRGGFLVLPAQSQTRQRRLIHCARAFVLLATIVQQALQFHKDVLQDDMGMFLARQTVRVLGLAMLAIIAQASQHLQHKPLAGRAITVLKARQLKSPVQLGDLAIPAIYRTVFARDHVRLAIIAQAAQPLPHKPSAVWATTVLKRTQPAIFVLWADTAML